MPVRYIGRKGTYKGKFLFNLLCNLKNFGIGRMFIRKSYLERWPEPSYFILKQATVDLTDTELKRGHVICQQVFRGKHFGDEVKIKSAHKPDWWLVPKGEEGKFLQDKRVYDAREVPAHVTMPPLLAKMYTEKLMKAGREVTPESTQLFLRILHGSHNRAVQPGYKPKQAANRTLTSEDCDTVQGEQAAL